jgi:hypothetical protein
MNLLWRRIRQVKFREQDFLSCDSESSYVAEQEEENEVREERPFT